MAVEGEGAGKVQGFEGRGEGEEGGGNVVVRPRAEDRGRGFEVVFVRAVSGEGGAFV